MTSFSSLLRAQAEKNIMELNHKLFIKDTEKDIMELTHKLIVTQKDAELDKMNYSTINFNIKYYNEFINFTRWKR